MSGKSRKAARRVRRCGLVADAEDTAAGRKHVRCGKPARHHLPDGTPQCPAHWRMSAGRKHPVAKVVRIESLRGRRRKPKERERITPEALTELIQRHSSCVLDQQQRCPLLIFTQAMCWELNVFFGVGNEEDRAFRRCDDMPAARPLSDHSAEAED